MVLSVRIIWERAIRASFLCEFTSSLLEVALKMGNFAKSFAHSPYVILSLIIDYSLKGGGGGGGFSPDFC